MANFKKSGLLGESKGRKALGRGLGALIPPNTTSKRDYFECELDRIRPEKSQPRRNFDRVALEELAESIKASGLIQPLVVRQDGPDYRLIAGERRWRASRIAGLRVVPVVIKEVDPDEAFELALVENIQRQDLNPLEEAAAYERLMSLRQYTQDELAQRVGRSRPTISNTLRLLRLHDEVQLAIINDELSEGAARALLSLPTEAAQVQLAKQAIAEGFSVRRIEAICRRVKHGEALELAIETSDSSGQAVAVVPAEGQPSVESPEASGEDVVPSSTSSKGRKSRGQGQTGSSAVLPESCHELLQSLSEDLDTKVSVDVRSGKRVIQIAFEDVVQLESLLKQLSGR